jgi:phosphoglycerate dehydrogenase-like enzyme
MRIHIQNPPDDPLFDITRPQWDDAAARAGPIGLGHEVTIGGDDAAFGGAIGEAEALITATPEVRHRFVDRPEPAAGQLRLIFVTSAGLDRLAPFDWLRPHVTLLTNSGVHGTKAAEFAIMAILMLSNGMPGLAAAQRAHHWRKYYAPVLSGRPLVVIGLGSIGSAVAREAAHFGMKVVGVRSRAAPDPSCERVVTAAELDAALADAEFVVVACPLTSATRDLLDRRRLALLPKGAGIVNVGRGAVVDEAAMCDLLEAGHLSGAVVDVFADEPIPASHRLWETPNLVITPHVSADDPLTYNPASLDIFFDNLRAEYEGRPMPNRFDPERGY